ncbi:hypothetical protein Plhal304r1_c019g0067761 [Plasmopara halstedii]
MKLHRVFGCIANFLSQFFCTLLHNQYDGTVPLHEAVGKDWAQLQQKTKERRCKSNGSNLLI